MIIQNNLITSNAKTLCAVSHILSKANLVISFAGLLHKDLYVREITKLSYANLTFFVGNITEFKININSFMTVSGKILHTCNSVCTQHIVSMLLEKR